MDAIREFNFDEIAFRYDSVWSDTPVGRAQRSAVWSRVDPLFSSGDRVLDLGCGTGVDALHLQSRGIEVHGIDRSRRMVEMARARGIVADYCPIERLHSLDMPVDGVLSNFGALNCLESLVSTANTLGRVVRSGGHLALCFMSPVCLWEIAFYLLHGKPKKAFRRLRRHAKSSIGGTVFYPSSATIVSLFRKHFRLLEWCGIGLSVPPSYVTFLTPRRVEQLAAFDQRVARAPVLRSLADHRLYIFKRL